jgi:Ala-tRNA(Pro) deacylase
MCAIRRISSARARTAGKRFGIAGARHPLANPKLIKSGAAMNVTDYLTKRRCWFESLPHSPVYTAQWLAEKLHVPGQNVAKCVLLRDGAGDYVVAVLSANHTIDFELTSQVVDGRVSLAHEDEISRRFPDCDYGILMPFGSQYGLRTIVDSELAAAEEIVFEGNTYREAIRMRFDEFRRIERPTVAAFAKENPRRRPK